MINLKRMDKAYTEVYLFLDLLGDEYIKRIPKRIYDVIENYRDITYTPDIQNGNSLSKEAITIIAALNLQYWCNDPNEKQELKKIYIENTQKEKEKIETKVDYSTIFNNNKSEEPVNEESITKNTIDTTNTDINIEATEQNEGEETALVPHKENIFTKIKSFFAKLFHKE